MKPLPGRVMPYPEARALEDALASGVTPMWLFKVLLPVWAVEIQATITPSEPYDLIDHYLERGIAEAGLTTVGDLADFLTLDTALVDRALRFLAGIGHVTRSGDGVALTELGRRSVAQGRRLLPGREDRRILYFDAFRSRPLTKPYYESRDVSLLSGAALGRFVDDPANRSSTLLTSTYGFRREALTDLVRSAERERHNLPEGIDDPRSLRETMVFLPLYVVRGRDLGTNGEHGGRGESSEYGEHRHLAYSQADDTADDDLSRLCDEVPEIAHACAADAGELDADRVRTTWVRETHPDGKGPTRQPDGSWRTDFPPSAFGDSGGLSYAKLGSYKLWRNTCIRIWCDDKDTRRRALIERLDTRLASRGTVTREHVEPLLTGLCTQLDVPAPDFEALITLAERHHKPALATQLGRLRDTTTTSTRG